jgi:hypothetical protein
LKIQGSSTPSNPFCQREKIETVPCMNKPCPCKEGFNCTCDLTPWAQWSHCSKTCGGGQRERVRQFEGKPAVKCAPQNLREVQPCNVECCPVNGRMTHWSHWTPCSKECGSGTRKRFRSCTAPEPSCKGKPCTESTVDTKVCNTPPCGK